jgi:hypothetical protein
MLVTCPYCHRPHDILALEPTLQHPDAYLEVPERERAERTMGTEDMRAVRDAADTQRRYFLRVLVRVGQFIQNLHEVGSRQIGLLYSPPSANDVHGPAYAIEPPRFQGTGV